MGRGLSLGVLTITEINSPRPVAEPRWKLRGTRTSARRSPSVGDLCFPPHAPPFVAPQNAQPLSSWWSAPGNGLLPVLRLPAGDDGDGGEEMVGHGGEASRRKHVSRKPAALPSVADARCRVPGCRPVSWSVYNQRSKCAPVVENTQRSLYPLTRAPPRLCSVHQRQLALLLPGSPAPQRFCQKARRASWPSCTAQLHSAPPL